MNKFEASLRKATRKVAQTVHPTLTISTEAVKILSQIQSNFNDVLIEECCKNFKPKKGDGVMREDTAQKAVEKLMKGQLRNLAIANAHKTLELHSSGILAYTPKAVAVQVKKKKGQAPEEFVKCVAPLTKMVNSDVKINKEARETIALLMFQMSNALIGKAQTLAEERGELTPDEIIMAVDFYMTPNMAKHAISEGTRNGVNFMTGFHYYTEEDFATKRR